MLCDAAESALVLLAQSGRSDGFDPLVHAHRPRVLRLARAMLRDAHLAEDAAQETFARAFRGIGGFRRGARFGSWVTSIALNVCRDALKRPHQRPVDAGRLAPPRLRPAIDDGISARTLEALAQVPSPHRDAFLLRHVCDLPYADCAAILGVRVATLRTRAHRARAELRRLLIPFVDTVWRMRA